MKEPIYKEEVYSIMGCAMEVYEWKRMVRTHRFLNDQKTFAAGNSL